MQSKTQSGQAPLLQELIVVPHYKNSLVVRHYGRMTMQQAMAVKSPTLGRLSIKESQEKMIESLGRVFVATSLYFDKPMSVDEGEIIAVEMLNDYEMSNLKLEDVVVIIKELKEAKSFGRLTPNKVLVHIRDYWERRVKTAVSQSIDNSQRSKDGATMGDRVKKTIALPDAQLARVDRTRKENNKYLK